jgi:hypothetical protein
MQPFRQRDEFFDLRAKWHHGSLAVQKLAVRGIDPSKKPEQKVP